MKAEYNEAAWGELGQERLERIQECTGSGEATKVLREVDDYPNKNEKERKFRVLLNRSVTQGASLIVFGADEEEAENKAMKIALEGDECECEWDCGENVEDIWVATSAERKN